MSGMIVKQEHLFSQVSVCSFWLGTGKMLSAHLGQILWEWCHSAAWLGCWQSRIWTWLWLQFSQKHWTGTCICISKNFCWEKKFPSWAGATISWSTHVAECTAFQTSNRRTCNVKENDFLLTWLIVYLLNCPCGDKNEIRNTCLWKLKK